RAEASLEEHDDVELLHPKRAERVRDGDRQQKSGANDVVPDEQRAPPQPVDPGPSDKPDQQHARARDDHKYRQLPRAGTEDQQRDERHRGPGDDRTELGHGLTRPELDEILVLPQRSRYHGGRSVPPRGEVVLAAGPLSFLRHPRLEERVDEVNALNVYPVPDGDTGTNMLHTMRSALKSARAADPTLPAVSAAAAHGALMGARGNSGVILSQVFRALKEAFAKSDQATVREMRRVVELSRRYAYDAVTAPAPGTILTLIRAMEDAAAYEGDDAFAFLR